ncbi:hypothetical protein ACFQWB_02435, partial [Paenibacillus thermoaerophilus]
MQISWDGLVRSLAGGGPRQEARTIELRPGQLVQGTVVRPLDGGEALVSINGVPVKAKLETSLPAGQPTLLQVQSDPTGQGAIILKPFAGGTAELSDEAARQLLKGWGMEASPDNRAMLRAMAREGVPLTADHLRAVLEAWQGMPKGTPMGDAARAAAVALARQLPLTAGALQALQAALSGPAAHELLEKLGAQLDRLLAGGAAGSEASRQLASKLADAVRAVWTAAGAAVEPEASAAVAGGGRSGLGSAAGAAGVPPGQAQAAAQPNGGAAPVPGQLADAGAR